MNGFNRHIGLGLAAAMFLLESAAAPAVYPDRPVHMLVGVPAGGGNDFLGRLVAQGLSKKWGQPVVVENRVGADGTIAGDVVAHSPPDGYTILIISDSHTITPSQYKLNYDPVRSFAPVAMAVSQPEILVVNPSEPFQTAKDLVAYAKANPNKLNFGSGGAGTRPYLSMQLFMHDTGIKMVGITYNGTGPSITSLLGGETQALFAGMGAGVVQVKSGNFRPLAITSKKRSPVVPTVAEAVDLPEFDGDGWLGLIAPAGTPREIVAKIHDDMLAFLGEPETQKILAGQGFSASSIVGPPEAFTAFLAEDIARWSAFLKSVNTP